MVLNEPRESGQIRLRLVCFTRADKQLRRSEVSS